MRRALLLAMLLSACGGHERLGWTINTSNPASPVAVYGPNRPTEGDAELFCLAARDALVVFIVSERALTDGKPIILSSNGQKASVRERFEEDGLGVANFEIPRSSGMARVIASGAGLLSFMLGSGEMRLPLGKAAGQVARDCLASRGHEKTPPVSRRG